MKLRSHRGLALPILFIILFQLFSLCNGQEVVGSACYGDSCRAAYRQSHEQCPGRYCGRPTSEGGTIVEADSCGSCPWGSMTDHWACQPCKDSLSAYSIAYLFFVGAGLLLAHFVFIFSTTIRTRHRVILFICAAGEVVVAVALAVLIFHPTGSFNLYSCGEDRRLSDWYTILSNPTGLHCATEAAYPLWTLVMVIFAVGVLEVLLVRAPVSHYWCHKDGQLSVYCALNMYPALLLIHVVLGGLIYFAFPYLVLVSCAGMDILYFILHRRESFTKPRWLIPAIIRYLCSVFAIISLILYFDSSWFLLFVAFTVPALVDGTLLLISIPLANLGGS